jgi:hypothetical protein
MLEALVALSQSQIAAIAPCSALVRYDSKPLF